MVDSLQKTLKAMKQARRPDSDEPVDTYTSKSSRLENVREEEMETSRARYSSGSESRYAISGKKGRGKRRKET
jgi:hypothetical protein